MTVEELPVRQHNVEERENAEFMRCFDTINQAYWNGFGTLERLITARDYIPQAFKALVREIADQHRRDYETVMRNTGGNDEN